MSGIPSARERRSSPRIPSRRLHPEPAPRLRRQSSFRSAESRQSSFRAAVSLLGRRSPSSRSRLLRTRSPRLGACFLPFCFGLDRALCGLLLWRFRFLGDLFRCLFRRLCLPCYCPFGPFGHHTLVFDSAPEGRGCISSIDAIANKASRRTSHGHVSPSP